MRFAWIAVFAAFVWSESAGAVPLDVYGQLPSLEHVTISPDGTKVAYVANDPASNRRLIVVQPVAGGAALAAVNAGDNKLRDLDWADNTRLLILSSKTAHPDGIMLGPRQEFFQALVLDLNTGKQVNLMDGALRSLNVVAADPIVRMVNGHPIVFAEGVHFPADHGRLALFAIDLDAGRTRIADEHAAHAQGWLVDAGGNVVSVEEFSDVSHRWALELKHGDQWAEIYGKDIAVDTPDVAGFTPDGKAILLAEQEHGHRVLKAFSTDYGDPVAVDIKADDIAVPLHARLSGRIIGVARTTDTTEYRFFDPQEQADWKRIAAMFWSEELTLVSRSDDHTKIVVLATGASHGNAYYLIDVPSGSTRLLGSIYNGIGAAEINPVTTVSYAAQDGRAITAYLTLPKGRAAKNLPLIVLPHGGPASRDEPGFDWWSQAYASLGYAVLQPQFRGSEGFGWDLLSAGFGEWGRKMQTDLSDGVRAMARDGVADPKRVCIVGASYGGYAAMAGPTLDPGVYRCAVALAGLSDLRSFIAWRESRTNAERLQDRYWLRFMGASSTSDPALDSISPAMHVDKVTVPMLLIHGRDDTVVAFAQSEEMEAALRRAGKPVQFVELPGEDHWLSRSATRNAMLKATADFLQTNNPP